MLVDAEGIAAKSDHAQSALATIARLGIPPTPQNFAVWYEYHENSNPDLRRTIDVLMSNHREFDEELLDEIYERFFTTDKDQQGVRETARRVQETLREVADAVADAGEGADRYGAALRDVSGKMQSQHSPLAPLVARLIDETNEMARRSDALGYRLEQSARRIEALKNNLDDVRRQAMTDGLTGIANRRHFEMVLREQASAAMETGDDLCLLLIDIDHFKSFNDTWGHQTGDEVLKLVAKTLVDNIKGKDMVARYGGEEFIVLLPKTALAASVSVANSIRIAFEKRRLVSKESKRTVGSITVSIGVARYEPGEALAELIRRADAALYDAKSQGRNRVVAEPDIKA
jgi:diguanylate cyclase